MTYPISDVTRRIVYSGSAGVGPYSFAFEVLEQTDIAVYKNTSLLTLTTDYTVTINVDGTGSITLVSAATEADQITIVGDRAVARSTDFVTGGDLFANSLNDEFDSLVIFTQQVDEKADRGLKAPVTDPTDVNMELPAKATRKGTVLAFNATTGDPEAGPTIADTQSVADSIADIETVADNIAVVNTVADNIADVNTVAGISGNVTTVAGISANVTTVAGIPADVTTVAGISTDVTSVADGLTASTATGVAYFNGSSVFTSGSNLTFDDSTKMLTIDATIKPILRLSGDGNNANDTVFGEIQFYNKDVSRAGPNSPATIRALSAGTFGNGGQLSFSTSPYTETTEGAAPIQRFFIDDNGNSFFYSKSGTYGSFYWDSDDTIVGISASGVAGDGGDNATLQIGAKETSQVTFTSFLGKSLKIELNETAGTGLQNAKITHSDGLSIFSGSSTSNALFYSTGNVSLSNGALTTDYATGDVTISGNLTVQGTTVTLDNASVQTFTWGDNDKAIFGDGEDLQIYSDGTTGHIDGSVILDDGTANGVTYLNGSKVLTSGSALTFNGSTLDVTGTVVADGLTVDGNPTISGTSPQLFFQTGASHYNWQLAAQESVSGAFEISSGNVDAVASDDTYTKRLIVNNNGDISFYEDTGTTAKFFWDASAEALVLGTATSVSNNRLVIEQASGDGANSGFYLQRNGAAGTSFKIDIDSSDVVSFRRSTTQVMTIDSSGNIGIGTSSPAYALSVVKNTTGAHAIDVLNSTTGAGSSRLILRNTSDTSGSGFQIINNANDGNVNILNYKNSALAFWTNATERLRIASNGDISFYEDTGTTPKFFWDASAESLGIGTSSPVGVLHVQSADGGDPTLYISTADTSLVLDQLIGRVAFYKNDPSGGGVGITSSIASYSSSSIGSGSYLTFSTDDGSLAYERARFTSNGDFLTAGKTSTGFSGAGAELRADGIAAFIRDSSSATLYVVKPNTANTTGTMVEFRYNASTTVGSISYTASSVAYNTSSDYRLKEDWVAVADASTRVNALKPVNFAWKADGSRVDGFLAHELAEVVPEAVTGEKDAVDDEGNPVYQGIDQSKLVPLLTAALQEALAKIESLTARVSALEGN